MNRFRLLSNLLCLCWLTYALPSVAQSFSANDSLIFQLGLGFMLTENFAEAESCFAHLAKNETASPAVGNNRGINLAMWGLSRLKKQEAEELIRFVFPLEIAPDLAAKGNDTEEAERRAEISRLFIAAAAQFSQCLATHPDFASAYLNLGSVQAILSRWQQDSDLLRSAFHNINQAEELARQPATKGRCLIVKGIIYDYLDNPARRNECFDLARRQHDLRPDEKLSSLIQRNQAIVAGGQAVFTSKKGENYNVMEDDPENIDGVSLRRLMASPSINPDLELSSLGSARLMQKNYSHSKLFLYFRDENRYIFFHKVGPSYGASTSKGIQLGDQEAYVMEAYGIPWRTGSALGGKFLYYKKAKLIFFIEEAGRVDYWMVWRGKGR